MSGPRTLVTLLAAIGLAASGAAAPGPPEFPPGTQVVPFELRNGLIHARATLHSPSGDDVTGPLVLDTGAPGLALRRGVIGALRLDTLVARSAAVYEWVHRPLESVEMGSASAEHVELGAVIADSLFGGTFGLFGPSLFGERGMVIDYAAQRWAIVPRGMGFTGAHPDVRGATNLDHAARLRRSRADFGAAVPAGAQGVRFRLFAGGRMLLRARVEDADGWRSPPLTLLLDTGASRSVLFQDVMDRDLGRAAHWPWLRDVSVVTAYGVVRADQTILPRLVLADADPPISVDRVEATALRPEGLPSLSRELAEPVDGLLGYTFLARFTIMVDYVNQILWLAPVAGQRAAPVRAQAARGRERADVGIQLESRWGDTRVAAVRPGSPAERERVAFGDIVTSIDGIATVGLTLDAAQRLLEGRAGSQVAVVVRRGGMQQVLRLTREPAR